MYIHFDQLPDSAKILIFQSDRKFTDNEERLINDKLMDFTNKWTAHKLMLNASYIIKHKYFIIIGVDEDEIGASGCSIDALNNFIKNIGNELNIDFFNRLNIAFWIENEVKLVKLQNLQNFIISKTICNKSNFFNNLATEKKQLYNNWVQEVSKTWLNTYFK